MPHKRSIDHRPKVVSLFSGAGGLDIGLAAAGMDIAFESDVDSCSCQTLESNGRIASENGLPGFGSTKVVCGDVRELTGTDILNQVGAERFEIDVLAGGPPCQAFSVFGRRGGTSDQRGTLVFEYARILQELAPKVFVFENVYGLLSVENGEVFQAIKAQLASPGDGLEYVVQVARLNARDYGVPQSRDRVIVVGIRSDISDDRELTFAPPPIAVDPESGDENAIRWRTVRDAFRTLPSPGSRRGESVANHRTRKHGPVVTDRYSRLRFGERDSKTRINRLDPNKPSFTIVVGSDAGGGKGHVHPTAPREVSPRESARLQTFPDWWTFDGGVRDEIRQVGNAVPPLLGYAIGRELCSKVFKRSPDRFADAISVMHQDHLFGLEEANSVDQQLTAS